MKHHIMYFPENGFTTWDRPGPDAPRPRTPDPVEQPVPGAAAGAADPAQLALPTSDAGQVADPSLWPGVDQPPAPAAQGQDDTEDPVAVDQSARSAHDQTAEPAQSAGPGDGTHDEAAGPQEVINHFSGTQVRSILLTGWSDQNHN